MNKGRVGIAATAAITVAGVGLLSGCTAQAYNPANGVTITVDWAKGVQIIGADSVRVFDPFTEGGHTAQSFPCGEALRTAGHPILGEDDGCTNFARTFVSPQGGPGVVTVYGPTWLRLPTDQPLGVK